MRKIFLFITLLFSLNIAAQDDLMGSFTLKYKGDSYQQSSGSTRKKNNGTTNNSNNSGKTYVFSNKDGNRTTMTELKCFSCNGVGTPTCQVCGGLGWQASAYGPMTCPMCAGKGKVICSICHGSGKNIWVGNTNGNGSNTQQSINTSSKVKQNCSKVKKSTSHTRDCGICGGTGICSAYGGHYIGQTHCAGSGTCGFCYGTGRTGYYDDERPCPNCDGKLSNGWGNGKCSSCHGTGKCSYCKGTGKKSY